MFSIEPAIEPGVSALYQADQLLENLARNSQPCNAPNGAWGKNSACRQDLPRLDKHCERLEFFDDFERPNPDFPAFEVLGTKEVCVVVR